MMFDAKETLDRLIKESRDWFDSFGSSKVAVLGISGGKDSTITAAILARALGKDRVLGILMPNGVQPDINDSYRVVKALGIRYLTMNIAGGVQWMTSEMESNSVHPSADALVNLQPRLRMATLYAWAQTLPEGAFVVNTCNRSEDYIGYSTKFGDCAGDVSVLGNYLVSEVLAIGDLLPEIPYDLVHKAPSDGLWGDTDEDRIGFTYAQLEDYIKTGASGDDMVDTKILRMYKASRHKYNPMPMLGRPTDFSEKGA